MLPARFASGGGDLLAKDDVIFERLRGSVAAMIFQEQMLPLDPVFTSAQARWRKLEENGKEVWR